jgi:glycyl-tRNA synthetase
MQCWDAEVYMSSYGWIEVVGHADRSAYDLKVHGEKSKVELVANKIYEPAIIQEVATVKPNFPAIGKQYGKQGQGLTQYLKSLNKEDALQLKKQLQNCGEKVNISVNETTYSIDSSLVEITVESKKISSEKYIPHVIEPSYGLGRILYGVLDHSFYARQGDEKRVVLGLPPLMAPIKVAVLPLSSNDAFTPFIQQIHKQLTASNIESKIDTGAVSIGRRYARADEVGTAYDVTVDFDTVEQQDRPVTIRERDSTQQIRVPLDKVTHIISDLLNNIIKWEEAYQKYPQVVRSETE